MRTVWMAGLALVVLGASPLLADEWSRSYPVQGRPELHVEADDASVRVEAATGAEIMVQVTTEGWRIGSTSQCVDPGATSSRCDTAPSRSW
jgi:hypothetical protein